MKPFDVAFFIGLLLLVEPGSVSAQTKASKVFLLEDAGNNQCCVYNVEATWNAAVQDAQAIVVGTITYSNDHLSQIDVTT